MAGNPRVSDQNLSEAQAAPSRAQSTQTAPPIPRRSRFVQSRRFIEVSALARSLIGCNVGLGDKSRRFIEVSAPGLIPIDYPCSDM